MTARCGGDEGQWPAVAAAGGGVGTIGAGRRVRRYFFGYTSSLDIAPKMVLLPPPLLPSLSSSSLLPLPPSPSLSHYSLHQLVHRCHRRHHHHLRCHPTYAIGASRKELFRIVDGIDITGVIGKYVSSSGG